ncbi:MAG: hypothetical protein V4692_15615 [Bdellovibrionota bacterium]
MRAKLSRIITKVFNNPWRKPSRAIFDHVDGTGNGFELDDLLTIKADDDLSAHEKIVIEQITAIHAEFRTDAYPVGTSNPASFDKLRRLAEKLELKETSALPDTGFYLDDHRQIIGPSGSLGLFFNDDDHVVKDKSEIGVYVEDGAFFRVGKKILFAFSVCSPTGHELTRTGRILGPPNKLPWDGL